VQLVAASIATPTNRCLIKSRRFMLISSIVV
jgi:hypothetical protein